MILHLLTGALTGWSLIIAVGPQNALVLRQGIRREHLGVVLAICIIADVALIGLGTIGIGGLILLVPWLLTALKWLGAAYLVWFALITLRYAWHTTGLSADAQPRTRRQIVRTTLALTFLNPGVYLDTVVMVGNLANQQGADGRWWFMLGAMAASVSWFLVIGFGSRALAPVLAKPRVWQAIDVAIAVVILGLAIRLVLS